MSASNVITMIIAIIGCVISVSTFFGNKSTKNEKNASKTVLIEYRLDELGKKVDKILEKLDFYDNEIDTKIEKSLKRHIAEYHKKG